MNTESLKTRAVLLSGGLMALGLSLPMASLIKKAAGIKGSAGGLGGIVNAVQSIQGPLIVTVASIAILAIIAGGAALIMGHRRAMGIIGGAIGGVLLVGAAVGIVD